MQKLTGGAIASSKALLAAVGGVVLMLGGPASAQDQGLEVRLSGQINRGVMHVDDGAQSDVFHVDNENSSTRFRLTGSAPIAPDMKVGVLWEMEFQSNAADTVNFANRESKATLEERHIDVFFERRFGKLSLGQGSGAADNAIQVDLSGTAVAHYSNVPNIGGAFAFRTSAGAAGPGRGRAAGGRTLCGAAHAGGGAAGGHLGRGAETRARQR